MIMAAEILPENLPDAWDRKQTTALAVAASLSQKFDHNLPWKTVRDVITASLNARFTELDPTSAEWPCDYYSANGVILKVSSIDAGGDIPGRGATGSRTTQVQGVLDAECEWAPSEIQDLSDAIPKLLSITSKSGISIRFTIRLEVGDPGQQPESDIVDEINSVFSEFKGDFQIS